MTKVKRLAKIREIPIEEIDGFQDHPYKVRDDKEMAALVESIRDKDLFLFLYYEYYINKSPQLLSVEGIICSLFIKIILFIKILT